MSVSARRSVSVTRCKCRGRKEERKHTPSDSRERERHKRPGQDCRGEGRRAGSGGWRAGWRGLLTMIMPTEVVTLNIHASESSTSFCSFDTGPSIVSPRLVAMWTSLEPSEPPKLGPPCSRLFGPLALPTPDTNSPRETSQPRRKECSRLRASAPPTSSLLNLDRWELLAYGVLLRPELSQA